MVRKVHITEIPTPPHPLTYFANKLKLNTTSTLIFSTKIELYNQWINNLSTNKQTFEITCYQVSIEPATFIVVIVVEPIEW